MSQALTQALVAAAVCPDGRERIDVFDSIIPGLALRVGKAGRKTWCFFHRLDGKRKRVTIASAAMMSVVDARNAALRMLGRAPTLASLSASCGTFDALVELFFADRELRPNSAYTYKRIIDQELLPKWHGRVVASLRRADVYKVTDEIVARGAYVQANRVHRLIINLLNLAVDSGWIGVNFAHGIRPPGGAERRCETTLTIEEVGKFWVALDTAAYRPVTAAAIRFLLLTGQRKNEVRGLIWDEIDLRKWIWVLPAERARNGYEHSVPLGPTAQAVLRMQKPKPFSSSLVFSNVPANLTRVMRVTPGRWLRTATNTVSRP